MKNDDLKCAKDVGGQAVIEGVMMRAGKSIVVSVRTPSQNIEVYHQNLIPLKERFIAFRLPILRGLAVLIESLIFGVKALTYSANIAVESEEGESSKGMSNFAIGITFLISFALGIGLFVILPERLANLISDKGIIFNIADGIIRLIVFLLYIILVSRSKEIRRVFQYHGAEHKSIHTYEAGEDLTEENAMKYSPVHPRCGTAFLMTVMVVGIIVFSLFGKPELILIRIGTRIVFIPIIAGVSYEIIKFASKRQNFLITRLMIMPGLWLQRLTTKEPTRDQVTVALVSLKKVLAMEGLYNEQNPSEDDQLDAVNNGL